MDSKKDTLNSLILFINILMQVRLTILTVFVYGSRSLPENEDTSVIRHLLFA